MASNVKIAVLLTAIDRMSSVVGSAISKSQAKLSAFSKKSNELGSKAFEFGGKAGAMGLGAGALLLGPLKAAADMERMQIALRTSFQGSEKEAEKAFKIINNFAAKTPYELGEVMTGFIKLKNMGLDPSTKALEAYGNTASAMGKSLNDMIEAVADAATGEFERLKEFGIKASSQGDKVTFMFQGVKTSMKKDAAHIEAYLKKLGLTKFAGGIEAQSKSLYGQLSTLGDNARMMGANIGKLLIPRINALFQRIGPVIDKMGAWIAAHPKLTEKIMLGIAAFAAMSLAVSGLSFVFGGIFKVVAVGVRVFSLLGKVISFVSNVIKVLRLITMLGGGPVLLIIGDIAAAAFLLIRYWKPISAFFGKVWDAVKAVFVPVIKFLWKIIYNFTPIGWIIRLWKPLSKLFGAIWGLVKAVFMVAIGIIKAVLLKFTPIGLIIKHWSKISGFFVRIWNNVKAPFVAIVKFVFGIGKQMFNAGANIINSIVNGIKSKIEKVTNIIKSVTKKIRDFFPFSPAKTGPLKDIHKIKLVETIAASISAKPLMAAMSKVTGAVANAKGTVSPVSRGGSVNHFTYAPVINGGGDPAQIQSILDNDRRRFEQQMDEVERRKARRSF